MTTDLKADLEAALHSDPSLRAGWQRLQHYKEQGGTKEEALAVLETIRDEATNDETEDRVLELMDFVVGFCSPQSKIWDG